MGFSMLEADDVVTKYPDFQIVTAEGTIECLIVIK